MYFENNVWQRTRGNTKLFADLNQREIEASSDLLAAFVKQLHMLIAKIEHFLLSNSVPINMDRSNLQSLQRLLMALEQLKEAVQSHLAFLSAAEAASIWRTQRFFDASLSFPSLLTDPKTPPTAALHASGSFQSSQTLLWRESQVMAQQWLQRDRPLLRQNALQNNVTIQIVTYGTEMTEGLQLLLMTAELSGLPLKVRTSNMSKSILFN